MNGFGKQHEQHLPSKLPLPDRQYQPCKRPHSNEQHLATKLTRLDLQPCKHLPQHRFNSGAPPRYLPPVGPKLPPLDANSEVIPPTPQSKPTRLSVSRCLFV